LPELVAPPLLPAPEELVAVEPLPELLMSPDPAPASGSGLNCVAHPTAQAR
jgi:hypothetical protein